ncbi:MAG: ATP-dependent RNA helicase DbpA [Gammaproteobacteria bacterium]|nr:ATP-dependent RNA helicase DbpA [Gammaproteobacteria bacterium]MCP4277214.1 ATP-dependent RNA helicase DbpA [Gammaproteobacteria bacterium]MCP4832836.1 ATP-dependent RNA helicase DbpA [Gammaproteobacteria bacterium]MCP4927976.1 ATP-dependent RNA helicase DbpA [Gammaproteobacteria bacterium]
MTVSANQSSFAALKLSPELLRNLTSLGYVAMTPIQAQSLPLILTGKDVIGQAKTGSGKTAAFALGLLAKLDRKKFRVQGLVLCPTRELADQVANAIRELARTLANVKVLTLTGGSPFGPQAGSLEHGAHIVVGTPGRVDDHLRKGTLKLNDVNMLVLDEADRMLDMGFQKELDMIVEATPAQRQTLMFSATFQDEIKAVAGRIMFAPERVTALEMHDSDTIEQYFYITNDAAARLSALRLLLLEHQPESAVVFCNTKKETQELAEALRSHGFSALAIHGDLEQNDRDRTLVRFANKSVAVLVATDVAARGLDIAALDAVINYQLASDDEVHVHRIGRTGRAGSTGIAMTFYADKERYKVNRLEKLLGISIEATALPPIALLETSPVKPAMVTLQIDGGKKQKIRPGDILGALTGEHGITGKQVGKINIFDSCAYVAVSINAVSAALKKLNKGKLKGRAFKARRVDGQPENSRRIARRRASVRPR